MLYPSEPSWRAIKTTQSVREQDGLLRVPPAVFKELAFEAFKSVSHHLRTSRLRDFRAMFDDPRSSANEKFAAFEFLKNATIAANGVFPLCQDTGTAVVFGEKGHLVMTDGDEEKNISDGIGQAYETLNLRYSQNAPSSMFCEKNTKTNLPAQIDLTVGKGKEYRFLFVAKGGGSANKTFLFQETRALLNDARLFDFLVEKCAAIGTSACPPYRLAVVIGGTSAETNLKTVKLASACALDEMPATDKGFRDRDMERRLIEAVNKNGLGAQFGGSHFCFDARVFRLSRHGASVPVGIGVSCAADRNVLGKITSEGAFLERLEDDPARFMPDPKPEKLSDSGIDVNLDSFEIALKTLSGLNVGDRVSLSGTVIVARDIAHARFKDALDCGKSLPDYLKNRPIYYAGPAKTPRGEICGSFGPTTAGRMDGYVDLLQKNGASKIMIAKGARGRQVVDACRDNGGFFLGTLGGAAAATAGYIKSCRLIDFADLGMEAVYEIKVEHLPAFVLIDDKGNDFYRRVSRYDRS